MAPALKKPKAQKQRVKSQESFYDNDVLTDKTIR